jgi:pimeloyl-ACP methyl ester carboxylesterase
MRDVLQTLPVIPPSLPELRTLEYEGCRLSYRVLGEGPPVLLIQGVAVHGDAWWPQVVLLSVRYRCLWFDNRGLGRSQPRGAALSVAQMADDARALMDAEGWASAHIVGHSLGGPVALELALSARPRVRSLALLCTFANGRDAGKLTPRMLWVGLRTQVGTRSQRRRAFLELVMPPALLASADRNALAAQLAPVFGRDLGVAPAVQGAQLAAMRAYDATPRLGQLAGLPTLVVSAAHDPIAPPSAGRALAAGIPGARYVEVAQASHGLPIQEAAATTTMLEAHFALARGGGSDQR